MLYRGTRRKGWDIGNLNTIVTAGRILEGAGGNDISGLRLPATVVFRNTIKMAAVEAQPPGLQIPSSFPCSSESPFQLRSSRAAYPCQNATVWHRLFSYRRFRHRMGSRHLPYSSMNHANPKALLLLSDCFSLYSTDLYSASSNRFRSFSLITEN